MRNGKEYQQSIHQQIVDLLEKGHLGNNERSILNKLDFGTIKILFYFDLKFCFFRLNRNIITGFTRCI